MPRLRATLRGKWWTNYFKTIRFCYSCGGPLVKKFVKEEKSRRLVCTQCGQITYINPKVVAGLIPVTADGKIALLRRDIEPAKGRWTYPAGFQEMGESVSDAAVRETWEEICAKVHVQGLVGIYAYADAGVVTIVYAGTLKKGQTPAIGHESQEVGTFRPSEIPWRQLAFRSTRDALKDWLKIRKGNISCIHL